jgi:hypothetical protein
MYITTRFTFSMITGAVLLHEGYEYSGPVALCKGDSTAQAGEQSSQAFQNTLQSAFSSQYANQQNSLNYLNGKMQAQVNQGGQGYNASTLAAMRTSANDQVASAYQGAKAASQNTQFNEGGQNLPSGVNAQINAAVGSQAAQAQAGAQQGITQSNAQLQNSNYWNAVGTLSGVAGMQNATGLAGAANSAGDTTATLGNTVNAANQSQLLGALGGIAGGAGSAFGGAMSGGLLCPAEGSLILLADGTERLVEWLAVGDQIAGQDGKAQTIDTITSAVLPVIWVITEDGHMLTNSFTHCYAMRDGGFVIAAQSFDKEINTTLGYSKVTSTVAWGSAKVFSIETQGTHTYRADGVWAYGVGHIESDQACEQYLERVVA